VPESGAACGLPAPLSVMVSVPSLDPDAVDVKVTLIWHFPPAGRPLPQLLVWLNSALAAMEVILSGPLVPSWTICGLLVVPTSCGLKVRLEGVRVTAGCPPVPESGTVCGLAGALSATLTAAFRVPASEGLKVTPI